MNSEEILQLLIGAFVLSQVITTTSPSPLGNTQLDKIHNVNSARISHELFENEMANKELVRRAVSTVAESLIYNHFFWEDDVENFDWENSWVRNLERSQRRLGDFDAFNALFQGTTIILPDALNLPAGSYLWYDVYLDLTQIRCRDFAVDNIVISHEKISNQRLDLQMQIFGIKLSCDMIIDFRQVGFPSLSATGTGSADSQNSTSDTIVEFISDGFDYHPPKEANLGPCASNVTLGEFTLGGDSVFFSFADLFKSLFKSRVESEIETVLCSQLGTFGVSALQDLLMLLNDRIENYTKPLSPELANPLHAENNLAESDDIKLVNFQEPDDNSIVKWFVESIDQISNYLGSRQADSSSPTGTGEDLAVNSLIRSLILNENREYIIPFSDWPIGDNNGLIFDVHDRMTRTRMYISNAKIFGLDTMSHIDPLNIVGKYTLANHFSWKELILEVDLELRIVASTLPDSIFESVNDKELVENVTLKIGIDNIDADIHFLLALDDTKLKNLDLSQVLNTTKIISCLFDTVHRAEVTGLSVNATDIHTPILEGFISNGIDRVISSITNAFFDMYKVALIRAMPNFFQTEIRGLLNNATSGVIQDQSNECVPYTKTGELKAVDFRDLLLDPDEAKARGATGDSRYGDVARTIMNLIEDELLANDPESMEETPLINRVAIRPFTKSQSGVEGMLRFNDSIIGFSRENINDKIGSAFADSFHLHLSDFRLFNLDTFHNPIKILDPENTPTTLNNTAHLGERDANGFRKMMISSRKLIQMSPKFFKGSTRFLFEIKGAGSPFEMKNDVDLSIVIPHIEALAAFKVFVIEDNFMSMKLENILNLNCWLAMMPSPELDGEGFPNNTSVESPVQLIQSLLLLSDLQTAINCISCSSIILTKAIEVLQVIDESGAISEIQTRLVAFASEVMQGTWLITLIARELNHAPNRCPGHPAYIENYEAPSYNAVPFPVLSEESMQTVILCGAILSQAVLVLVAESHSNIEANTSDPLSAQKNFNVPSNITLIDLTNLNSTFGGLADMAISELRSVVNSTIEDATGPKAPEKDIWVNVQLRSLLLDENRSLSIDVDGLGFSFGGATIELNQVRLKGLDTFKSVNILDIIAPQTILNNFLLERITVEVDMIIDTFDNANGPKVMTITTGLKDVNVSLAVFLAINEDALGDLELGSLLHMKNILPCLLSSLYRFEITQLAVSVSDIDIPTFEGYVSTRTKEVISSSMDMIFQKYKSVMIASMPAFFDVTIRQFATRLAQNYIDDPTLCPSSPLTSRPFINFGDLLLSGRESLKVNGLGTSPYGENMRMIKNLMDETILKIDPIDGTSAINEQLIRGLTKAQSNVSGTLILFGNTFGTRTQLDVGDVKGVIEFRASDARLENLDTVGQPLKLLDPIEQHVLNNTATFGVGSRELRAAVSLVIAFEDENHYLRNEFDMSLDIKSAQVVLAALMRMSEKLFLRFPIRDFFNIHCWLSTIPAPKLDTKGVRVGDSDLNAALQKLTAVMSEARLHINCTDCSSPGMHSFASYLSSPDAVKSVTNASNDLFGYVTSLLGGKFLQIQIDRFLSEAPAKCPHNPKYDPSATVVVYPPFSTPEKTNDPLGFLFVILGVCLSLICIISLLIISVRRIRRRRHERWIQTLSKEEILEINDLQRIEKNREDKLNQTTTRMISSPTIPAFVRYFMPVVIFGNIAFFLSGHLSLGASVNIRANIAGDTINIDNFFKFSMARSTLDMWNAGAKTLAILVGLFAGAWPYTKQFITLFLWIAPPKVVSVSRRESVFLWLDRLAKWSIVDIFVLLMSVAAFNISVNSPESVTFLPPNLYSLKLLVVPLWGMYANMTAQLLSQIISHVIIHYHRKLVAEALGEAYGGGCLNTDRRDESMVIDNEVTDNVITPNLMTGSENQSYIGALCNHRFDRDGIKKDISLYVHSWVNYIIVFLAATCIVLIICGCSTSSFSLEVIGIAGLVVELGQDFKQATTRYTVFDYVNALSNHSNELGTAADKIGLGTLSSLLIISVFIVPILQVVLFLSRWFRPHTSESQIRIFVALEILDAWQYIEVYILSVVVAAWQLGGVSEFMINSFCGSLEDTFESLAYYGIVSDEDAQCFRLKPRVQGGLWLLLTAALILAFMNNFICKAAAQQERDIHVRSEENESEIKASQGRNLSTPSIGDCSSCGSDKNIDEGANTTSVQSIKPATLHFTDYYRWFLYREVMPVDDSIEVGIGISVDDHDKSE